MYSVRSVQQFWDIENGIRKGNKQLRVSAKYRNNIEDFFDAVFPEDGNNEHILSPEEAYAQYLRTNLWVKQELFIFLWNELIEEWKVEQMLYEKGRLAQD